MATLSIPDPGTTERPRWGRAATRGPVIVTSRGDASSDGALRVAMALAEEAGCATELIAALDPAPLVAPEFGVVIDVPDDDSERRHAVEQGIAGQLRRVGIPHGTVHVDIRIGEPTAVMVGAARDAGARVLVLGASHHDLLDRMFGLETAVRTARAADVPVLVVPPSWDGLPRSALVAVDFSDASVRAARAALALFPGLREIVLAHVAPPRGPRATRMQGPQREVTDPTAEAFDRFRESIDVPPEVRVSRCVADGAPGRELLRIADERGADLIVAGSHGRGALQRIFVGSVASALLRRSPVPVMVLPAQAGIEARDPLVQTLRDPRSWPRALDEFSKRNAGRLVTLGLEDPERGAANERLDTPFLGCAFDPVDRRLAVALGDRSTTSPHTVRAISGVSQIYVLRGEDDRDRVLRIVSGVRGGQMMLVFTA